GETALALLLL
nr:Chain C, GLY-GLU-THR-ALA-LEU-ALA-LEU-LEU-LEU-LEU [Severe acute respiratory syndrome-related coronavirus]